jgi:hypothetical protein
MRQKKDRGGKTLDGGKNVAARASRRVTFGDVGLAVYW